MLRNRTPKRLSLLLMLPALLVLGACDPSQSNTVKSNRAITSWASNDYVSCRDTTLEIILAEQAEKRDDYDARALHAWCQMALGNLEQADAVFKAVRSFDPKHPQALLGDVWVKMLYKNYDDAESALKHTAKWVPESMGTLLHATEGWLAFYQGDLDMAEQKFRKAESVSYLSGDYFVNVDYGVRRNWSTLPWVGMGWVEMYRGKPEASRQAFLQGIERDPGCHRCYDGLARLYMGLGKRQQAFNLAAKGLSLARHDASLITFVNEILFDERNPALSVRLYEQLVEKTQGDPHYLANLGYARYYNGDINGAALAFESALQQDPDETLALAGRRFIQCIKAGGSYARCIAG